MNNIDDNLILSVIIPVYNSGKYVEECIESTYNIGLAENEFELVVINDGSTDDSLTIINKCVLRHNNIVVINEKNGGLSKARNIGMKKASGKYVMFLDSDDYYSSFDVRKFINIIKKNNLDALEYGFETFVEKENGIEEYSNIAFDRTKSYFAVGPISGQQYFVDCSKNSTLTSVATDRVYNLDFLRAHNLTFKENTLNEDDIFSFEFLMTNPVIMRVTDVVYKYRRHLGSITLSSTNRLQKIDATGCIVKTVMDFVKAKSDITKDLFKTCIQYIESAIYWSRDLYKKVDYIPSDYHFRYKETYTCIVGYASCLYEGYFARKLPPSLVKHIKSAQCVVIYGAGRVGKGLRKLLEERGIEDIVMAITTNNQNKTLGCGIYPIESEGISREAVVLVANINDEADMVEYANKLGYNDVIRMSDFLY